MQEFEPGALYEKAMSPLGIGAALWHPEDRVEIGDVGYLSHGSFIRMFNVMLPPSKNGGALPEDYDVLQPSTGKVMTEVKPMIKTSKNISLKSPSIAEFTSSQHPFPMTFHFVAHGGPGAVLVTLENAISEEIKPCPEFEAHFMDNYRQWICTARECFGQILREEDLILVRGHTKIRSRWVTVALNGSGPFTLEVDERNGASLASEKDFPVSVRYGLVSAADAARKIYEQELAQGFSRTFVEENQCLLVKLYSMKKRVFGSPRVVSTM